MRVDREAGLPRVVLASASPRRADILHMVGLPPDRIEPARVEEVRGGGESPEAYVERLALEKAQAVAGREDGLVLAGDTVVVLDGQVLEKPDGRQGAVSMLLSLADREHTVWTWVSRA